MKVYRWTKLGNYYKWLHRALHLEVSIGSLIARRLYHGRDPPHVVGHIGVDSVLAAPATAIAKTCNTHHRPPATHFAQKWPARITRTSVRPTVSIPRTEHIISDLITPVRRSASLLTNDRNLQMSIQTHISCIIMCREKREKFEIFIC